MKLKRLNRDGNPSYRNEYKIHCNYENKQNEFDYLLVSMDITKSNEIVFKFIEDITGYQCTFTREETLKIIEALALYLNSKSFVGAKVPHTYLKIGNNHLKIESQHNSIQTDIENDLYEDVIDITVSALGCSVYIDDNDAQALLFTLKSWVKQLEFAEAYEKVLDKLEDE